MQDSDVKSAVTYQPFSQTGGGEADDKPEVDINFDYNVTVLAH